MKKLASNLFIATLGGIIALVIFQFNSPTKHNSSVANIDATTITKTTANKSNFFSQAHANPIASSSNANNARVSIPMLDFTEVAASTTPAVVHIKTKGEAQPDSWEELFRNYKSEGDQLQPRASGSGVIINSNGYIVTNNHVIEDASEIEVNLHDKRVYTARLIGTDPNTDLAVLKINDNNLAYIPYGNSDRIKVGEWVMAVGNPFSLSSTVTTGIVSAKARNMEILKESFAVESFIQTDAAVNPGNSGGALVNLQGQLIGVNTAIASPTGYFAGYSFAVPVNIVKKVVADIIEFGEVKRGFLGVAIREIDTNLADDIGLSSLEGVYIERVNNNSAASDAGIVQGDIITEIAGTKVSSTPALQEQVSLYRPGDRIAVTIKRNNRPKTITVKLKGAY